MVLTASIEHDKAPAARAVVVAKADTCIPPKQGCSRRRNAGLYEETGVLWWVLSRVWHRSQLIRLECVKTCHAVDQQLLCACSQGVLAACCHTSYNRSCGYDA